MRIARVVLPVLLASLSLGPVSPVAGQPLEGNPSRGAAVFGQCVACHSVEPGAHLRGRSRAGVWGRRAGPVEGFTRCSEPLKHAAVVWDAATLDRWLEDPQTVVPHNLMTFPGLKDARQRADLVAYLKAVATGQAPPTASGGGMMASARADLKTLGPERRVRAIRHCGDGYHVTTEDSRTVPFWEFNLRFKTDSTPRGPERGKPVLVPGGMQGDRAQVVFSGLDDLKRFLVERCEEGAR